MLPGVTATPGDARDACEGKLPRIGGVAGDAVVLKPFPNLRFLPLVNRKDHEVRDTLRTMTTYTKIPDEERPTISVDALQPIARIEDNTYGGFTE